MAHLAAIVLLPFKLHTSRSAAGENIQLLGIYDMLCAVQKNKIMFFDISFLHHDSRFHFYMYVFGGGMKCVGCDTCVQHLWFVCVFPWGIPQLQSDWNLSCDHGLD